MSGAGVVDSPSPKMLRAAMDCTANGLCVLPAVRTGDAKRPAVSSWKQYQSRLPSGEELASWFTPDPGAMCIVCGTVSGHLEMIDFDLAGEAFMSRGVKRSRRQRRGCSRDWSSKLRRRADITSSIRCESPVDGNRKLAHRRFEADDEQPVEVGTKTYTPRQESDGSWAIVVTDDRDAWRRRAVSVRAFIRVCVDSGRASPSADADDR
jgi:hypothetical protein